MDSRAQTLVASPTSTKWRIIPNRHAKSKKAMHGAGLPAQSKSANSKGAYLLSSIAPLLFALFSLLAKQTGCLFCLVNQHLVGYVFNPGGPIIKLIPVKIHVNQRSAFEMTLNKRL